MIYLIRHGQTDENIAHRLQGQRDFPLNETGLKQAEEARDLFRERGISFDRVYTSPLSRAARTAEIITGDMEMTEDDRLMEMSFGPYEGTSLMDPPVDIQLFFMDFVNNLAPEGMEQLPDLVARLGRFLEDLRAELRDTTGMNVLISTHAIALKAALEYLTPGSNGSYWNKSVKNCAVYVFELKEGEFSIPGEWR